MSCSLATRTKTMIIKPKQEVISACCGCKYNLGTCDQPECDHPKGPKLQNMNSCSHFEAEEKGNNKKE
jgi:hypothetical protein